MEKYWNRKLSRRSFLNETGKIIGMGILAHFSLIGNVNASYAGRRAVCGLLDDNECAPQTQGGYRCTTPGSHKCTVNNFDCQAANKCTASAGHHE